MGDDVATPWREGLFFSVDGEEGGVVEIRDHDHSFYVFLDDLDLFDSEKSVRRPDTAQSPWGLFMVSNGAASSLQVSSWSVCQHSLLVREDNADVPPTLYLEDVWAQFFGLFIGSKRTHLDCKTSRGKRREDLFGLRSEVRFHTRCILRQPLRNLADESGFERTKTGIRAVFADRDLAWIQRL